MNPLAIALYITAGCHTALLLMIVPIERPPWYLLLSIVFLWPVLVPTILVIAAIDCLRSRWSWRRRKPTELERWVPAVLLCLAATAPAVEWDVDQRWYAIQDSNHGQHLAGGAVLGAGSYALASLATSSRPRRYVCAVLWTAAIATLWEIDEAHHGSQSTAFADPIDIAWTTLGGLAGAALADITGQLLTVQPRVDGASVAVAWRW